jgi:hypothetical protein
MSTHEAGSTWNRWKRRAAALTAATTIIAAPLALLAQPTSADVGPIADAGMTLKVAQATLTSSGTVSINYQSSATVIPGRDTLLQAQYFNNGSVDTISSTMKINLGGPRDTAYTLDPACADGANNTVTCSYGTTKAGTSQPPVYSPVKTATSTITSTGTETSFIGGVVPIDWDSDDSATATTYLSSTSGVAFLTDGQSTTFTSTDGKVKETFTLPTGATGGGGYFVQLKEITPSPYTCGDATTPCYNYVGAADFAQVGGSVSPTAANPLQMTVTYLQLKQNCNGLGGPSGCAPLFYAPTGQTGGATTKVPTCTTYAPNYGTPYASNDPCIYNLTKTTQGIVTYSIALLKDVSFPVIGTLN